MGEDKAGKIGLVGHHISVNNGSLQDSKISRLAGQIAMLMRVKISQADGEKLVDDLGKKEDLTVRTISDPTYFLLSCSVVTQ